MKFNIPILEQLSRCQNLLIAGMGGGFDIFCGLPIYFELQQLGYQVHLANFSFSDILNCHAAHRLTATLVGITAEDDGFVLYFPELYLARWFQETRDEQVTIWCFHKTGVRPLLENYEILIEQLSLDGILLIDGGIDSLIRGDEPATGTLIEDATSLCVVNTLTQIPTRLLGCTAFGAEQDITYAAIFENIATLTAAGGFLGVCSLTPQMDVYRAYKDAVLSVHGQKYQDPSVINSSIISAVQGHYGNYHLTEKTQGSRLWISPLMPLYWFFDLPIVAEHNLFLPQIQETETFMDAMHAYMHSLQHITKRSSTHIPL